MEKKTLEALAVEVKKLLEVENKRISTAKDEVQTLENMLAQARTRKENAISSNNATEFNAASTAENFVLAKLNAARQRVTTSEYTQGKNADIVASINAAICEETFPLYEELEKVMDKYTEAYKKLVKIGEKVRGISHNLKRIVASVDPKNDFTWEKPVSGAPSSYLDLFGKRKENLIGSYFPYFYSKRKQSKAKNNE